MYKFPLLLFSDGVDIGCASVLVKGIEVDICANLGGGINVRYADIISLVLRVGMALSKFMSNRMYCADLY